MESYRIVLKRVGIVLLTVGSLDIAYMLRCLWQGQPYSSWFNVLGVVAGILLIRGTLRFVSTITWLIALLIALFSSNVLLLPWLKPAALWAVEFRLDFFGLCLSLLGKVAMVVLLIWAYSRLRSKSILSALSFDGYSASRPMLAFILGLAFVVVPLGIMCIVRSGMIGVEAVELAKTQYGDDYRYYLTAISWADGQVIADLTAYNSQAIKLVRVEWMQPRR